MADVKRLIDADALLRRLQKRREDFASGWRTLDAMPTNAQIQYHENLECAIIVEDIPIVDAVEVVRCKDCRHFKPGLGAEGVMFCKRDKLGRSVFMRNDDFCSYGERKDNDTATDKTKSV